MCKIGGNYFNSKMASTKECWRQGSSIQYYFAIICHKSQKKTGPDRCLASKIDRIWSRFFLFFQNRCANFAPLSQELQTQNYTRNTGGQK